MPPSISATDSSNNDCYIATTITDLEEGVEVPLPAFEAAAVDDDDDLDVLKLKQPSTPTTIASTSSSEDTTSSDGASWSSWSKSKKALALTSAFALTSVIVFSFVYIFAYNPVINTPSAVDSSTTSDQKQVLEIGNDGSPSNLFPLGECRGDCDSDEECEDGLICFQRYGSYEHVPGCNGGEEDDSESDYCIRPIEAVDNIDMPTFYPTVVSSDTRPITSSPATSTTTEERPKLPRDFFLLSGQSNMEGHTTSSSSIQTNGNYWRRIRAVINKAEVAEANGVSDYLSTMVEDLYRVISETNDLKDGYGIPYLTPNEKVQLGTTLTKGVVDLYKSSLLNDLDSPLQFGKCSYKAAFDSLVEDVSQGTVPAVWNANCGRSFGHELMFSRTLELAMNYTTPFEMHKVSRGGSALYQHWYPNHGQHWHLLKGAIEERQGHGDWKGFIWHQGSQEAWSLNQYGEDRSLTYYGNLTGLVSEVRELMFQNSVSWKCKEEIPVVIVQVGFWPSRNDLAQRTRDAQAKFCTDDPRAVLVKTDDLSRFYHYDAPSFLISGNRIAHAYQEAMKGVVECPGGDLPSLPSESSLEIDSSELV